MCRVLYSIPTDKTRDVSFARCPFNSRADNKSSRRATRGCDESPKMDGCIITAIFTSLLMSYESLWQELKGSVELQ